MDNIANYTVAGWAFDPDRPSQSIDVHFYVDSVDASHWAGCVTANQSRPDVGNWERTRTDGNAKPAANDLHGYTFQIPASSPNSSTTSFRGGLHTLLAFPINVNVNGVEQGPNTPALSPATGMRYDAQGNKTAALPATSQLANILDSLRLLLNSMSTLVGR